MINLLILKNVRLWVSSCFMINIEMSKCIYKYLDYNHGETQKFNTLKSSRNHLSGLHSMNKRYNTKLEKLKTPYQRRQELKTIKSAMDSMNSLNKEIGFKRKRARVIKNEYQHGILGVDDPIDQESKLYQDKNKVLQEKEEKLRLHLMQRQKNMAKNGGVSEQINFSTNDFSKRRDEMHHEISPLWSRKKRVVN